MRTVRPIATGLLTLAVLLPTALRAADPVPAKKDSPAKAQPKDATLSVAVTPREAKPGETVTLKVTAKMSPGWHIYGFNKVQPESGPRVTQFDLFDPAGLTVKGDWTPSAPPVPKKEDAFPDLEFVEIHEDEVTWSLTLTVPADATAGAKSIKVQASYQICSDQTCSFPGRWTLPAVALTVLPADAPKRDAAVKKAAAEAAPPKPAKKDSNARAKPTGVTLTPSVTPTEVIPGGTVTYKVTAKVAPGTTWHIYKYGKDDPGDGPKLTTFDVFDPAGLTPKGEWTASKDPIRKKESAFPNLPFLEYYEDEVTWSLTLAVPSDTPLGKKSIRCQAGYMVCNEKTCSQPGQWTLEDVAFTVVPVAAEATVPPPTPAPIAAAPAPIAPAQAPPPAPKSDVEAKAALGLLPFLMTCAGGGLLALVMPCVWPMIPITVNFFVKQGQKKKGQATGLAIAYCLAIIGVFTGIGVLFSIFFGAASLSKLANNPWINFGVAGLFLAFGLSLLGLFEIRLPNFLLNASSQGEGRGGMVGVMFMALTLTITSFTCTFPVVGGLLVMAAGGSYLYPVIGLATFASVIALPFFLLALSPGLISKMPKSGDWMNTVKVVGGLVEIGAAFKFINAGEVAFVVSKNAFFNAYTVLAIWVVLALVCGIYLLGLFRTDHDQEAIKVGPGRMILGSMFLFFSLFLTPALFGRPPQSRLWYLVVGLLPADAGSLKAPTESGPSGGREIAAKSTDPKVAAREQKSFHGVPWGMSFEGAVEESKSTGKPILIDFTGVNCANCRLMEQEVLPDPDVVDLLARFVTVQLYTDYPEIDSITKAEREAIGEANLEREIKLVNEATNPFYVVINPDETVLATKGGKVPKAEFLDFLRAGLAKHQGAVKVARNDAPPVVAPQAADPAHAQALTVAVRTPKNLHGVPWGLSFEAAVEEARGKDRPVLVHFTGVSCAYCRWMEQEVFPKPEIIALLSQFATVQLYTDMVPLDTVSAGDRSEIARTNRDRQATLVKDSTVPLFAVVNADGTLVATKPGKVSPDELAAFLREGLAKHRGAAKVARNDGPVH